MILEVLLSTLPSLYWIHAFLFVTKSLFKGRLREGEVLWQKQGWLPRAVVWLSCDIS